MTGEVSRPDSLVSPAKISEFKQAQMQYRKAIQELEEAISNQNSILNSELRQEFIKNQEIIDNSIKDLQKAINLDPANEGTKESLLALYQKKVDLLRNKLKLMSQYKDWGSFLYQIWKM